VNAPFDPTAGAAAFRAWARRVLATFATLTPEERRRAYEALPPAFPHALRDEFWWHAHGGQIEPDACPDGQPWRIWAIVAGRGFGKTRAGAEWVWQRARDHPDARIALVAASLDEVAHVMVEGESGLLACARGGEAPRWLPSRGLFHFPSGAVAYAHTAERPARLRGFQHHFACATSWRSGAAPGRATAPPRPGTTCCSASASARRRARSSPPRPSPSRC
jgi:hypothetical protein